jgi:hypothetical protein
LVPRFLLGVIGLLVGTAIGALFTLAHRDPVLLAVGLAAIGCLLAGLRLLSPGRGPAIAGAVGVIIAIAVLGLRGPGGSIVIQDDPSGWIWQLGAVAVAAVVVAWPRIARPAGAARP